MKILNDPVHGFVKIPNKLIFEIIESRYFQRLRRISQTGLAHLVYPGARHSRFHHALGCLHLMQEAVSTLRGKGVEITEEEATGVYSAILLHDVGHGPFSHALESTLVVGVDHEGISLRLMERLNEELGGQLEVAIAIFKGNYPKRFLTQLVASQLDIDRLDYLKRDSFFTGVAEGNVNPKRIISMMNVHEGELVIDAKGVYSVEKFLTSRMFMYWQVYLHKTSVSAELYLISILKRAKELAERGVDLDTVPSLSYFFTEYQGFDSEALEHFLFLDDTDIIYAVKNWQNHPDKILSTLCKMIMNRVLPKSEISKQKKTEEEMKALRIQAEKTLGIDDGSYFVHQTTFSVRPYENNKNPIKLLYKNGEVTDLLSSDHQVMGPVLNKTVEKHHQCYLDNDKLKRLNL